MAATRTTAASSVLSSSSSSASASAAKVEAEATSSSLQLGETKAGPKPLIQEPAVMTVDDSAALDAMARDFDEFGSDSDSDDGIEVGSEARPDGECGMARPPTALLSDDSEDVAGVVTQVRAAMLVGQGEAIVEVGVDADGAAEGLTMEQLEDALEVLEERAATELEAQMTRLRVREVEGGAVAEVLVRALPSAAEFCEIRVAVVGNVDSGKSTLLGVLTRGKLDDGRGAARSCVFRHSHEIESGRTSSISQEILGYDAGAEIVNYTFERTPSWSAICVASSKVITFLDLAGHERYLKTTLFGLTGMNPSYAMMMVGANAGVIGMTKEHMSIALALKVPVYMVVTKIDMAPPNVLKRTLRQLSKLVKSPGARKVPIVVKTMDDVVVAARSFLMHRICPIFLVSNVTGENLDLLRAFINLLPARTEWSQLTEAPAEVCIDDTFSVPGVGCVVSGTVLSGGVTAGDSLLLGPNAFGAFEPVTIKSIEVRRHPTKAVTAGRSASFALKKIKRSAIRKGMRLLAAELEPQAVWQFEAEILILYHSTTISRAYEAVVHCGNVRQVAKIIDIVSACDATGAPLADADMPSDARDLVLRTGMRAKVIFRFLYAPEYLPVGSRLIFRDGRTKGVGRVLTCLADPVDVGPIRPSDRRAASKARAASKRVGRPADGAAAAGTQPVATAGSSSQRRKKRGKKQKTVIKPISVA
ncbi:GTP-binding protein 1 [Thecamonas trahens ATCC 50062]|uniref:GTP-binding protein 1 n=1 Tax=Thecamonas trahens ATCC 50062 TaxID=461836 RepID=A0A0L0DDA3_THETB|nr:GTP-binding protein 1 [Thecamonas trahens ATCC 50062]KNC50332.1 GTP-binding protein 1 [Thecamonas trahens ATCC 50062]|eukprot:XP_013756878.1 GTP-binding protein 1 [Thecamonas trahens ATCC 50062]